MNIFENISNISEDMQSLQYKTLKNNVQFASERKIIETWAEDYVDLDGNFKRDFQKSFCPQMWELYLHALFRKANFKRNMDYSAPDYIIESPFKFYVEAATANFRENGSIGVDRTWEDFNELTKPPYLVDLYKDQLDESISRVAKKLRDKNSAYNKYSQNDYFELDIPYVVAIGAYDQLNSGKEFIYPMLALLYGWYFDGTKNQFCIQNSITVPNTSKKQELNLFSQTKFENISAVIFSCSITIGKLTALAISEGLPTFNAAYSFLETPYETNRNAYKYLMKKVSKETPEKLEEGVFLFHNPNAKNPLDENVFSDLAVTQFFLEEDGVNYKGNISPLVVRKSVSKCMEQVMQPVLQEYLRMYNRLEPEDFYDINL